MSDVKHIYVLLASVGGRRIPMASFSNRTRCEDAVATELEEELSKYKLRMHDCDHFTVEQWRINGFLSGDAVKTLTSYDKYGKLDRRLVPMGMEGKTDIQKKGGRFKKLVENSGK